MLINPNCKNCKHFFWANDVYFKHGCKKYNIKTTVSKLPSWQIYEATREPCFSFEEIVFSKNNLNYVDIVPAKKIDEII